MDTIFLAGAGGEPAQSIARRLVSAGFRVYGFASQFPKDGFSHPDFRPVPVNLADPAAVRAEVSTILIQETTPLGVILAGNYPVEESFEATNAEDIALAVNAAVASPLTLVRALLPALVRRRGCVLAITRASGENPGSTLAATVAGALGGFARALFAELRDTGVKTAHIKLENNAGAPDPALRFIAGAPQSQIQPDIVADAVEMILRLRENNAVTELVLRPQATREEPRLPVSAEPRLRTIQVVQLPPVANFPPPRETIYTPERKRPDYAPPPGEEEERFFDDDNDDAVDPELAYLIKPRRPQNPPPEPNREQRPQQHRHQQQTRQQQRSPRSGSIRIHAPTPDELAAQQTPPEQQHQQHRRDDNRGDRRQDNPQNVRNDNRGDRRQQHPTAQNQNGNNGNNAGNAQTPSYPQNWHWPRPPSPQQLERIARRNAQPPVQNPPPAKPAGEEKIVSEKTAEPIREFVPPPPRETKSEAPEFVPPVTAKTPAAAFEFKPQAPAKKSPEEKSPDEKPRVAVTADKLPAATPASEKESDSEISEKPAKKKPAAKKKSGDEKPEKKPKEKSPAPRKKKT